MAAPPSFDPLLSGNSLRRVLKPIADSQQPAAPYPSGCNLDSASAATTASRFHSMTRK